MLRGHRRQDGLLSDYCDGSVFQSHPLFLQWPNSLQIMLYYDDVEVCNPLGTHKLGLALYSMGECILQCNASLHNIALFYYTLGNISPKYRSMLEGIQLLSVVKSCFGELWSRPRSSKFYA